MFALMAVWWKKASGSSGRTAGAGSGAGCMCAAMQRQAQGGCSGVAELLTMQARGSWALRQLAIASRRKDGDRGAMCAIAGAWEDGLGERKRWLVVD
jgi:hypothetical protein